MKLTKRNKPKQFDRSSGPEAYINGWYSYGGYLKDGTIELGVRHAKGKEIDRLIDWLQRVRKYNKGLK